MHPHYVYKKHHKPYQLLAVVILFCVMILSESVSSSSCPNFSVKKIKIFSEYSKGYVRIEGSQVVANPSASPMEKSYLYKVTIDQHFMLLYHIKSEKFICWNKSFRKLITKRNPPNLRYCKFEDKMSMITDYSGSKIRYTTIDMRGREVEIRFTRKGIFARPKLIENCVEKHKLNMTKEEFLTLNPLYIKNGSKEMKVYTELMRRCASPDVLPSDVDGCESGLPDFCKRMYNLKTIKGRTISDEITKLCRNEWSKK